ncbi:hypothetical protein [Edaphobacter aggregans]|uniref:hypothetical protein n=1 Tax=Edaphobacter aggregans TaxID=570835 RepID=UPI000555FAEF|nr:hypothetical protein [Edaphobacter aggregans]
MMMGMSWGELFLLALAAWTAVGALGVTVSLARGERTQAKRHMGWIAAVWLLYLAMLLTVSLTARPREVADGKDQCFHEICLAVVKTDVMPGYLAQNGERVVRATVRMTNRSAVRARRDTGLRAYLIDAQGRSWHEVPGLEGVRLTATVAPRGSVMSQPVFKVPQDATGLGLVFTHGRGLPGALVIGGPDSLLHPLVIVPLRL